MKYSGVKSYSKSFKDEGVKKTQNLTCKVVDLVPGSSYTFEVYGTSTCDNSSSAYVNAETKMKRKYPMASVNYEYYGFFFNGRDCVLMAIVLYSDLSDLAY